MGQLIRDPVSHVSSLRAVLRVPEHLGHEPVPEGGRRCQPDWFALGLRRKTKARHGRNNHVEGIIRRAAKTGGIGQWSDRFKKLEDRARPSVGKNQRNRLRPASLHVIKVNIEIADAREELRIAI